MKPRFEWGVSSLTHQGETVSGDKSVVIASAQGVLVAVIDALGHGEHAAHAAEVAARVLTQHAHEGPSVLAERCHVELRTTRGAAISMAAFDWNRGTMTWLGIGNVAGMLLNVDPGVDPCAMPLLVRGGVIGGHLPELQATVIPLKAETVLIMTSDGVRSDFSEILSFPRAPQLLAKRILDGYATHNDDAMALVFSCNCAA